MKAVSVSQLKKDLTGLSRERVTDLCIRLAKYKKDNKELLTYLLYEEEDEESYIKAIKEEIDEGFGGINTSHVYYAKKSLRKILRITNKYIRYSGKKQTEVELLIYFCLKMRKSGIDLNKSVTLTNLYLRQTQKIKAALKTLHEDLQFDYQSDLRRVMS